MSEPMFCPECVQGKHRNCTGEAWDNDADDLVKCDCREGSCGRFER